MDKTIQTLANTLKDVLVARKFENVDQFSSSYLMYEVQQAIGAINRCRNFTPTSEKLYDSKYEYLIIPMCVASIAKIGAEGESSHTENGISRTYSNGIDYPADLLSQIIPLIKG